ncbi:MAG: hypothetical protein U0411_11100 [Thermodesulfovibrionales bacterium]
MVTTKFNPVRMEEKPRQEHPENRDRHVRLALEAVGRVKGPPGIGRPPVAEERDEDDRDAGQVEPPGEPVDLREGDVPRADHDRQEEISEGDGGAGNDEKEDHDNPVRRKYLVIGMGVHEFSGRDEAEADKQPQDDSHPEEEEERSEVHDADALVVGRKEPGKDSPSLSFVSIEAVLSHPRPPVCGPCLSRSPRSRPQLARKADFLPKAYHVCAGRAN